MLTAEQEIARKGKMTGSRVACLMRGDEEKIVQMWLEMTGQQPEEDFSDNWPMRLGLATEQLNLEWYERMARVLLTRRGDVVTHSVFEWAAATLDGFDPQVPCPVECKHVGGREPIEIIIDRYQPQCQWQMFVTDTEQCALSVIMGTNAPVVDYIPRAPAYINEMFERADRFMLCVAMKEPPLVLERVAPPIDPKTVYNMTGNNEWASAAEDWLTCKQPAEMFDEAKVLLKSLMPSDAARCFGHGVRITRDRAGRLHIREDAT